MVASNQKRPSVAAPPPPSPSPQTREHGIVWGRPSRVALNSGEMVPVRYAVVEAEWLITSHFGLTYTRDPRYPVEAQPRDYGAEIELQLAVEARASSLDPWQILTDSVLPIDGPPVVRRDGVVVSGNGRTQSVRLAIARGLYDEILEGILERALHFRLDVEEIRGIGNPVLVRVMERNVVEPIELARYGIEMNRDPGLGMSLCEQSMGLSRLMSKEVVSRLADLVATLPEGYTLRDFLRYRAKDIAVVLSDGGIVDSRKRAAYFTGEGELTDAAKDLVETTLAGLTVKDIGVIRVASRPTRDRLVRVGVEFMRMRHAGERWDLAEHNNEAVKLLAEAEDRAAYLRTMRAVGQKDTGSLVERLLHPERFSNGAFDIGTREVAWAHPVSEALAMALELTPREYVAAIAEYARRAAGSWRSMFECLHPAEVFTETIGTRRDPAGDVVWSVPVSIEQWELAMAV